MERAIGVLVVAVIASGCSGAGARLEPAQASAEPEAASETPVAPVPPSARAGQACEGPAFTAGGCAEGLVCAPAPGGYCTASCAGDAACPAGTACTDTVRAGRFCFAECDADDDCRADEGYRCDATWRTCFLPGWSTPRPVACEHPLPPVGPWALGSIAFASDTAGTYGLEPAAALGADGRVVVAFMERGGLLDPSRIATATTALDGTLSATQAIETGRAQHFDPSLAAGPDGRFHLVWLGHDGHGDRNAMIGYATSEDGATWSAPASVHDAAIDCPGEEPGCLDKPMIDVAPAGSPHAGRIYVAYYGMGDGGSLRLRRSDDGATFDASRRLGDGAYGDLHVDARGRVHVVFVRGSEDGDRFGDAGAQVVYLVSDDAGDTFTESVVSEEGQPVPFFFSNPTIATDGRYRYVAYPTGTPDGRWRLMLASSRDGRTWSRIEVPGAACANRMTPTIAADRAGVRLIWAEGGGGTGAMVSTRCASGGGRCDAPTRIGEPFEAYSLVRHDPLWRGEYDALLVDPRRRRVHAVFTRPVRAHDDTLASQVIHATRPL